MSILKPLFTAGLFSSSIYFEYFGIVNLILNSFTAILSIYLLLTISKKELFFTGFFIGLFWFWWIFLTFQYYDLPTYVAIVATAGFGLGYAIVFYLLSIFNHIYIRAFLLFLLYFLVILGFNWFKPQLIFLNTYFDTTIFAYFVIIFTIASVIEQKKPIYLLLLLFALNFTSHKVEQPNLKIYMPQYNISQDKKWQPKFKDELIKINFQHIDYAIKEGYEFIILPETIFPIALNKNQDIITKLKERSKDIAIVAGALEFDQNKYYNTSYFFHKQNMQIARKTVLVPFGEAVPFPKFIAKWINDKFFGGAVDYEVAKHPTSFSIDGVKFRNAICYEATTDKVFENLDTKYMVVLTNNAWFVPSIEPVLQNMLIRYYAKKYDVVVYHSSNSSPNKIINTK